MHESKPFLGVSNQDAEVRLCRKGSLGRRRVCASGVDVTKKRSLCLVPCSAFVAHIVCSHMLAERDRVIIDIFSTLWKTNLVLK